MLSYFVKQVTCKNLNGTEKFAVMFILIRMQLYVGILRQLNLYTFVDNS